MAMQQVMPEPLWDEGISSFLYGEFEKTQQPLQSSDIQQFAKAQAVRVGDILETLFLMAIYGEWQYTDSEGNEKLLDENMLNALYAKGRISAEDLDEFDGLWSPKA
jgi:hypothetical protein